MSTVPETKITFLPDGTIQVNGAPPPMSDYRVNWGHVALTEAQATEAFKYGWKPVRWSAGFIEVARSEKDWMDYVSADIRKESINLPGSFRSH